MADEDTEEHGSWNWAYAIPIAALMIPIIAVGGGSPWFWALLITVVVLVGATIAGRYLLDHRHRLAMAELAARKELLAEERRQLDVADRILAADDLPGDLGEHA